MLLTYLLIYLLTYLFVYSLLPGDRHSSVNDERAEDGVDYLSTLQPRRANGSVDGDDCLGARRTRSPSYHFPHSL